LSVLVSPTGGGFLGAVDETLAALGRHRRVAVSVTSFLVVPALIAASEMICTVPARLAQGWGDTLTVLRGCEKLPRHGDQDFVRRV
jgi:DNA-binding transcriptional LysR family regulator